MGTPLPRRTLILAAAMGLTLTLAACGHATSGAADADASGSAGATAGAVEPHKEVEVADLEPRAAIAYDGGIQVLDTATGEVLADITKEGFLRLNAAGDGRHVMVSSSEGFEVLDLGLIVKPHGVAVPLENGNWLVTHGTEDERHTVQERDAAGKVVAETTHCPGIHGEATAESDDDDVASFGCENGPVVYSGGQFHTADVPEDYQRSGNQAGSEDSPYVLVDDKTVKPTEDGEPEHPTKVGLIDTENATVSTVELGSAYWFRSLGRGEDGEAVVDAEDAAAHGQHSSAYEGSDGGH